jgi:ABC-type multidrug transport system fused ATPase/permease subunit
MGWGVFICFFITNNLTQALKSMIDYWLKSRASPGDDSFSAFNSITTDFILMFAYLNIVVFLVTCLKNVFYFAYTFQSARNMFNRLMKSIIFSRMVFFDKNEVGRIINRISKDTATIDDMLPWLFLIFLEAIALVLAYPVLVSLQYPLMIIGTK